MNAPDFTELELKVLGLKNDSTDLYVRLACRFFGLKPEQVTPEIRSWVKEIAYSLVYSGTEDEDGMPKMSGPVC